MNELQGIKELFTESVTKRGASISALDLHVELAAEPPPIVPPPALSACLDALLDDLISRGEMAATGGRSLLYAFPFQDESPGLRLILSDDLPGVPPDDFSLYPHLAGLAPPSKQLPQPIREMAALADRMGADSRNFDLHSGLRGTAIWVDFPLADEAIKGVAVPSRPRGWRRLAVYDDEDLLHNLAGDRDIERKVLEIFLKSTPTLLEELVGALGKRDKAESRRLNHSIKGSAANVGGRMLSEVARAAEWVAHDGDLDAAAAIQPRIAWEFERLAPLCRERL